MLTVLPCLGGGKWWLSSLKALTFCRKPEDVSKTKFSVEIFELWAKILSFLAKKKNQTHSQELRLHALSLLLSGLIPPFLFYSSTLRVCKMDTQNFWALRGAWRGCRGRRHQAPRLWLPPRYQGSRCDSMAFLSLPSCSSCQVLCIFQISNKILFEKQTHSAPSKGKRNMHLNETPVFY